VKASAGKGGNAIRLAPRGGVQGWVLRVWVGFKGGVSKAPSDRRSAIPGPNPTREITNFFHGAEALPRKVLRPEGETQSPTRAQRPEYLAKPKLGIRRMWADIPTHRKVRPFQEASSCRESRQGKCDAGDNLDCWWTASSLMLSRDGNPRLNDIRRILEAASQHGGQVSSELLPLVYDELRALAARGLASERDGQTLQATALVHEAWLRLSGEEEMQWNDRAHFFRAAAQAMRRILVDRARAKASLKRGEGKEVLDIQDLDIEGPSVDERVLLVDEMMDRMEERDPDSARVITLKFFGGLTNKEIAEMDGVTERTIERQWAYARAKLLQMIRDEG